MRPAIVVFGAISAIEVALVRDIKAALQRFAVEETLPRFQNIVAGKFTAYFMANPHATMKERPAYDNLLAKQSRSCSCPLTRSGPNFIAGWLCWLRWLRLQ